MHRIDTSTAQKDKFGQGKNGFTNGDPTTGTPSTKLNSDICDALQEEVCTVIERAGIRLNKSQHDQLYQAIRKLSEEEATRAKIALVDGATVDLSTLNKLAKALGNDPKFAETCNRNFAKKNSQEVLRTGNIVIKSGKDYSGLMIERKDGVVCALQTSPDSAYFAYGDKGIIDIPYNKTGTLALTSDVEAIDNYPVGAPIPWPQANPPEGYLICDGQPFDKVKYPKLALAYPSGILPELRGEFIRGLSAGRKDVDVGRTVLSAQGDAIQDIKGNFAIGGAKSASEAPAQVSGVFTKTTTTGKVNTAADSVNETIPLIQFTASRVVRTADETRPRNVAFLYIVRAV